MPKQTRTNPIDNFLDSKMVACMPPEKRLFLNILDGVNHNKTMGILKKADDSIKNDKNIMKYLVGRNARLFFYASKRLQNNKEVVLAAVKRGRALRYASDAMKSDKEVVLAAVKKLGFDPARTPLYLKQHIPLVSMSCGTLWLEPAAHCFWAPQ